MKTVENAKVVSPLAGDPVIWEVGAAVKGGAMVVAMVEEVEEAGMIACLDSGDHEMTWRTNLISFLPKTTEGEGMDFRMVAILAEMAPNDRDTKKGMVDMVTRDMEEATIISTVDMDTVPILLSEEDEGFEEEEEGVGEAVVVLKTVEKLLPSQLLLVKANRWQKMDPVLKIQAPTPLPWSRLHLVVVLIMAVGAFFAEEEAVGVVGAVAHRLLA